MCACGCLCMFAFKCCFLWCFFKWVITIFLAEECEVAKGARLGMIMSLPSRKLSNTPRNFSHLEAKATSFTWCVSCSILFYYSFFFCFRLSSIDNSIFMLHYLILSLCDFFIALTRKPIKTLLILLWIGLRLYY